MGRPRGFDEMTVVTAAAGLFVRHGYDATSVDDLVAGSGLHRGSLYKAFGSKRGIFVAALRQLVEEELPAADRDRLVTAATLDLLLVAALELGPRDDEVRDLVRRGCTLITGPAAPGDHPAQQAAGHQGRSSDPATVLGSRLLHRAGIRAEPTGTAHPTKTADLTETTGSAPWHASGSTRTS